MRNQFVIVHGIGRNEVDRTAHRDLVGGISDCLPGAEFHVVKWNDLGFSAVRDLPDSESRPFHPPLEQLIAQPPPPYLFDRLAVLHQVRRRDVTPEHPAWTVQTNLHRGELRLFGMLLDYAGDVEVYLRDATRRAAIQQRLCGKLFEAMGHGPVTVISHSLGTLVAYDVIHQLMPPSAVRTLVTLGSPLENLLYVTHGTGLVTYDLRLAPELNWLNFYDIKDVIASKLMSGDFAREPRDDWLWRSRVSGRELELVREGSDERRPVAGFWNNRVRNGVRVNIGLNRESNSVEAHANYWKHSRLHCAVAQLIAELDRDPGP